MGRADDRTGLGSTAAALEALADTLPDQLRALAAELRGGPDEPPRADAVTWGYEVADKVGALGARVGSALTRAEREVDRWAFDHEEREDRDEDDDCLRRRAEAADGVLERLRRETDEADHA